MPLFGPPNIRKMKAKGDIEGLVKALSYQKDENIRKAAMTALGELGDMRAVDPIIPFLADPSTSTRNLAVQTLVQMGEMSVKPLILHLNAPDKQKAITRVLTKIGRPAVEPLISHLNAPNKQKAIARVLTKIGSPAVEPLISHLNAPDKQKEIARILTKIGRPAVEPLIRCLAAEDQEISRTAVKTLGDICDPRAIEPLIACLGSDSVDLSRAAVNALGNIADLRSITPLINVMNDSRLRSASKKALQKIGEPAIEPLAAAFKTSSDGIRKTIVEILAVIRGPRAIEVLNQALNDKSEIVKVAASGELAHIKRMVARNIVILENINTKTMDRQSTIRSLTGFGTVAIKPLLPLLKEQEIMTREAAIQVLSSLPAYMTEKQKEILDQATTKLNQDTREIKRQIKPLIEFLGTPNFSRDEIREIGQHINDIGGHSGMWLAYDPIRSNIAVGPNRFMLDRLWDRIGTWLA